MIICFYCDTNEGPFVRDHFVPESLGGPDANYNRVDACKRCDLLKRNIHPRVWMDSCPEPGQSRVYKKLLEMGILESGKVLVPGRTPRKKGLPRDGRSTSDGPGSWYAKPTKEELEFQQQSIERLIAQPMAPPPWSASYRGPQVLGTAKSLRLHARRYLDLKEKEAS